VTVTSLDAAADREHGEASAVLGDLVVDSIRFPVAALIGALDGGDGTDTELVRSLIAGRSYAELRAMVLLLADCADSARVTEACGVNPGLAAANARRMAEARHKQAEYAWLRDGGVCPEVAAQRCDIKGAGSRSEAETAFRTGKPRRRAGRSAAA
jgi:hypothetical protein